MAAWNSKFKVQNHSNRIDQNNGNTMNRTTRVILLEDKWLSIGLTNEKWGAEKPESEWDEWAITESLIFGLEIKSVLLGRK